MNDLEDEYVKEFVLAVPFDNVAIKSEQSANSVEDCNGELSHSSSGHAVTALPPISRLAPIPISAMQSPPHHLMTPPDEGYHSLGSQQALHPVMHTMKNGNHLIMYSNIPGTPPDTPPVSNSPPPQSDAYHLDHHHHHHHHHHPHQHQQYPHIHQTKHAAAAAAAAPVAGYIDETLWLSHQQSVDLRPRQEPLDLRNGDAVAELQNWNVTRQHMSVITTGNRILQTDYVHHHQRQLVPQQHCFNPSLLSKPPLMNSGLISPASSSGRTTSSSGRTLSRHNHLSNDSNQTLGDDSFIDDQELLSLPVRDLNMKLKGRPKEVQNKVKQRRRTLKNRGYAKNCRSKRVHEKEVLDSQNQTLLTEIHTLRLDNQKLRHEMNEVTSLRVDNQKLMQEMRSLQRRCAQLVNELRKHESNGRGNNNPMTANQYC